jgi:hypothetical protein
VEGETGQRVYQQSALALSAAVNDLIELQNGTVTFYDGPLGKIHFTVEMYGFLWEYRFTVEGLGANRSRVTLEVGGKDAKDPTDKISRQLALLDSLLPTAPRDGPGEDSS